jgi:flagellar basal body-associated protein FliL
MDSEQDKPESADSKEAYLMKPHQPKFNISPPEESLSADPSNASDDRSVTPTTSTTEPIEPASTPDPSPATQRAEAVDTPPSEESQASVRNASVSHELVLQPLAPIESEAPTEPTVVAAPSTPPSLITDVQAPASSSEPESPLAAGQVFGTPSPAAETTAGPESDPVVGTLPTTTAQQPALKSSRMPTFSKAKKSLALLIVLAVVILGGGGASAYYFGYYNNSSYLYSQALSNTGKGYTKLISYLSDQSSTTYKGVTGTGSFKVVDSGTTTDGTIAVNTNGSDSDTTFTVGLGVTRVDVDLRSILTSGDTNPDIYLKANGITGLGALTESAQTDQAVNQLNDKWIVIDHSLLDNLQSKVAKQSSTPSAAMLTKAQIYSELNSFGSVNQQYLFSTNKSKAVTTVLKTYGKQTIDGHTLYHYEVGFNKANVKQYITAQRNALLASQLGAWIKQQNYASAVNSEYTSLENSANGITSKDTIQVWADINTRMIYKVRISDQTNPAENYIDLGLNYRSGDTFPIFLNAVTKQGSATTTIAFLATLNTQQNTVGISLSAQQSGGLSLTANLNVKPTNSPMTITAPQGAEELSQVLDELGLGSLLTTPLSSLSGASTTSTTGSNSNVTI